MVSSKWNCAIGVSALTVSRSIELSPQALPGTPPKWLIRQHIDHLKGFTVDQADVVAKFQIEDKADAILCTPRALTEKKRDELVDDLQTGKLLYLDQEELWRTFRELYPRPEDLEEHLSSTPSIRFISGFAVSNKRLSDLAVAALPRYRDQGFIDILVSRRAWRQSWYPAISSDSLTQCCAVYILAGDPSWGSICRAYLPRAHTPRGNQG